MTVTWHKAFVGTVLTFYQLWKELEMLSGSILNTFLCYSKLCLGSAISLHCTLLGCGQNGDGKALANDYKLRSNNYQLLCLSCRQKETKQLQQVFLENGNLNS